MKKRLRCRLGFHWWLQEIIDEKTLPDYCAIPPRMMTIIVSGHRCGYCGKVKSPIDDVEPAT